MYRAVNDWDTSHIQTNDLKVDNIMCGIQSHAFSFPCYTVICKSLHTASFQFSDFQLKSFVDPKPVEL